MWKKYLISSATVSVAQWFGTYSGLPLETVSITLPAYAGATGYSQVTASFTLTGLNPFGNYVVYFNTTGFPHYDILTIFSGDQGVAGGLVKGSAIYTHALWSTGYNENIIFSLTFNSILNVNPVLNFAQGPGSSLDTSRWGCRVNTSYSVLQVNWQTLKVNTGYFAGVTSNQVLWNVVSGCESVYAPYGTAAACWDYQYNQWWSYANIDLTGTNYKVASQIGVGGWMTSGEADYSNNNQTVAMSVSGDCGFASAPGASVDYGGWDIQLALLY